MPTTRRQRAVAVEQYSFGALPLELQLMVADEVEELTDCAALCLALPPLGLAALQRLVRYQGILMSVALRLVRSVATANHILLNEGLLRFYVADCRATDEGRLWLNAAYTDAGSELQVQADVEGTQGAVRTRWTIVASGERRAMLASRGVSGSVVHYEGEKGEERHVRLVRADGVVLHFEGEKGAERHVRMVTTDGVVLHFEGENGAERWARLVHADGVVLHYEGEKGAERQLRACRAPQRARR